MGANGGNHASTSPYDQQHSLSTTATGMSASLESSLTSSSAAGMTDGQEAEMNKGGIREERDEGDWDGWWGAPPGHAQDESE